jgi:hypothetical protein
VASGKGIPDRFESGALHLTNYRTIFDASATAGAKIHIDVSGAFSDFDLEFSGCSADALDTSQRNDLNIGV